MEYTVQFGFVRGSRGDVITIDDEVLAAELTAAGLIEPTSPVETAGEGAGSQAPGTPAGRTRKPRGG